MFLLMSSRMPGILVWAIQSKFLAFLRIVDSIDVWLEYHRKLWILFLKTKSDFTCLHLPVISFRMIKTLERLEDHREHDSSWSLVIVVITDSELTSNVWWLIKWKALLINWISLISLAGSTENRPNMAVLRSWCSQQTLGLQFWCQHRGDDTLTCSVTMGPSQGFNKTTKHSLEKQVKRHNLLTCLAILAKERSDIGSLRRRGDKKTKWRKR